MIYCKFNYGFGFNSIHISFKLYSSSSYKGNSFLFVSISLVSKKKKFFLEIILFLNNMCYFTSFNFLSAGNNLIYE